MKYFIPIFLLFFLQTGCNTGQKETTAVEPEVTDPAAGEAAEVLSVSVSGDPGAYTFSVQLKSPDTGCSQYADWWEVIGADGSLKYRRILTHSHVDEQPFTRSGGPVPIAADEMVFVRGHMNELGYGSEIGKGTVSGGFEQTSLSVSFADSLASIAPLPDGCDF